MEPLTNLRASPTAQIKSVQLKARIFLRDQGTFRDLTPEELASVALRRPGVTLVGEAQLPVDHAAPDGKQFTVRDLIAAIERTEAETRGESEWFDGVDVHHVFFEGLHPAQDGSFHISWGS